MSETYLWVALGWLLGGVFNGIAGFGAALVAMPLVLPRLPASVAVPACTLTVMTLNSQMFWRYRHAARLPSLRPLLFGAVPGAFAGVLVLQGFPDYWLRLGLGTLLVVYSLWGLFLERSRHGQAASCWGLLAGFLSTLFGTAFGINGPPLVVYSTLSDWTQVEIKSALGVFFLITGAIMVSVQTMAGLQSLNSVQLFAVSLPAVLTGWCLGNRIARCLQERTFRKVLFLALLIMGGNMVWKVLLA